MGVQRAAAALRARHVHVVPVRREHARGRGVDVAEDDALHAAGHQRDARPVARAGARAATPALRHGGATAASGANGAGRRQPPERERGAQPAAVREDLEDQPAQQALAGRAAVVLLDVRARRLDQAVVLDARRARGHARHAAEAAVEVLDDGVGQRHRAVDEAAHQVDAAARRVHLLVPERVGRARRQAEAAVDAVGDQLGLHDASVAQRRRVRRAGSTVSAGSPSTYATRGPGRTSGAAPPSQRTRPVQAGLQRAHLGPRLGVLAAERRRLRVHRSPLRLRRARACGRRRCRPRSARARSGAARPSGRRRRRPCAARRAADAGGARCARRCPSRPREPQKSLPRS